MLFLINMHIMDILFTYRVFWPHPYVQKDFTGNKIKLCNRCYDKWVYQREEANDKGMRLFDDEFNEEICAFCSNCPEADLILCGTCPRSYCVNCLQTVLTEEVRKDYFH